MNIIFGKYQLNIVQFDDAGYAINRTKLLKSRFALVFGLGPTKIRWVLAHIGGSYNLRISTFYDKFSLINRERIISQSISKNYLQFVGVELKQLCFRQRMRIRQFVTAFKKPIAKKPHIKFKKQTKRLNNLEGGSNF